MVGDAKKRKGTHEYFWKITFILVFAQRMADVSEDGAATLHVFS